MKVCDFSDLYYIFIYIKYFLNFYIVLIYSIIQLLIVYIYLYFINIAV